MEFKRILLKLMAREDLSADEMATVMHAIMAKELTDAQIGAFLIALHLKGEAPAEIAAAVKVMRSLAIPFSYQNHHLIDIVGMGGDLSNTFNISTASSFVVAASGATVLKHGNRAASSRSGSADVLEQAGINLNLTPEQTKQCLKQFGLGFLFAPAYHPMFKNIASIRKQLGVKTLFNLLGPLIHPARIPNSLIGVSHKKWLKIFAEVCQELKSHHVLIVHSEDGLDEISIAAPTYVTELNHEEIREFTITPEQFGITRYPLNDIKVSSPKESLRLFSEVLENKPGAARNIVILNAGAAIYTSGLANTIAEGVKKALAAIESGQARLLFQQFIEFTQSFKET